MNTRAASAVWFLLVIGAAGCHRRVPVEEEPKPDGRKVGQAVGKVLPSVGRVNAENDLRQLGLFLKTAGSDKPITTLNDLAAIGLQREAPAIFKLFQDGRYALARQPNPNNASGSIVAYDAGAVTANQPVVTALMGDGSVQVMPAAQFQAALKGQGG